MSPNLKEGESSTTAELKTSFLGSAKVGEVVSGVATPAHRGRTTYIRDVEAKEREQRKVDSPVALYPDDPRGALARVGGEPGSRGFGNGALLLAIVEIAAHGALHQHGETHGEGNPDQSVHCTSP
jgi:hypothetical protein